MKKPRSVFWTRLSLFVAIPYVVVIWLLLQQPSTLAFLHEWPWYVVVGPGLAVVVVALLIHLRELVSGDQ